MSDLHKAATATLEALEEIALAGMSGSGQETKDGLTRWHASRAWEFISIAARTKDDLRAALAQETPDERKMIDRAWAQFCSGIGDSAQAPYPGMIRAFESYYSQSFADKDWRNESGVWAAAWKAAKADSAALAQEPAQPGAKEPVGEMGVPISCGMPLCSPGRHHPLCRLATPQPAVQEPSSKEAEWIAQTEHLNCPACGGSGHVGDVKRLSDEQINSIVREAAKGSATRRDGSTSQRIARATEAAVLGDKP